VVNYAGGYKVNNAGEAKIKQIKENAVAPPQEPVTIVEVPETTKKDDIKSNVLKDKVILSLANGTKLRAR